MKVLLVEKNRPVAQQPHPGLYFPNGTLTSAAKNMTRQDGSSVSVQREDGRGYDSGSSVMRRFSIIRPKRIFRALPMLD